MSSREIHFGPSDFRIDWYSGTGKGGQNRNKRQNCCRITHTPTGLVARGTEFRTRVANQEAAFNVLASRVLAHYADEGPGRRSTGETIRNYHAVRNEVHDRASGLKMLYKDVMGGNGFADMIEARATAIKVIECQENSNEQH